MLAGRRSSPGNSAGSNGYGNTSHIGASCAKGRRRRTRRGSDSNRSSRGTSSARRASSAISRGSAFGSCCSRRCRSNNSKARRRTFCFERFLFHAVVVGYMEAVGLKRSAAAQVYFVNVSAPAAAAAAVCVYSSEGAAAAAAAASDSSCTRVAAGGSCPPPPAAATPVHTAATAALAFRTVKGAAAAREMPVTAAFWPACATAACATHAAPTAATCGKATAVAPAVAPPAGTRRGDARFLRRRKAVLCCLFLSATNTTAPISATAAPTARAATTAPRAARAVEAEETTAVASAAATAVAPPAGAAAALRSVEISCEGALERSYGTLHRTCRGSAESAAAACELGQQQQPYLRRQAGKHRAAQQQAGRWKQAGLQQEQQQPETELQGTTEQRDKDEKKAQQREQRKKAQEQTKQKQQRAQEETRKKQQQQEAEAGPSAIDTHDAGVQNSYEQQQAGGPSDCCFSRVSDSYVADTCSDEQHTAAAAHSRSVATTGAPRGREAEIQRHQQRDEQHQTDQRQNEQRRRSWQQQQEHPPTNQKRQGRMEGCKGEDRVAPCEPGTSWQSTRAAAASSAAANFPLPRTAVASAAAGKHFMRRGARWREFADASFTSVVRPRKSAAAAASTDATAAVASSSPCAAAAAEAAALASHPAAAPSYSFSPAAEASPSTRASGAASSSAAAPAVHFALPAAAGPVFSLPAEGTRVSTSGARADLLSAIPAAATVASASQAAAVAPAVCIPAAAVDRDSQFGAAPAARPAFVRLTARGGAAAGSCVRPRETVARQRREGNSSMQVAASSRRTPAGLLDRSSGCRDICGGNNKSNSNDSSNSSNGNSNIDNCSNTNPHSSTNTSSSCCNTSNRDSGSSNSASSSSTRTNSSKTVANTKLRELCTSSSASSCLACCSLCSYAPVSFACSAPTRGTGSPSNSGNSYCSGGRRSCCSSASGSSSRNSHSVAGHSSLVVDAPRRRGEGAVAGGGAAGALPRIRRRRVVVTVYTDGACPSNGRPNAKVRGGIGVFFGFNDPRNISCRLQGPHQTNQRAELQAVLECLQQLKRWEDAGRGLWGAPAPATTGQRNSCCRTYCCCCLPSAGGSGGGEQKRPPETRSSSATSTRRSVHSTAIESGKSVNTCVFSSGSERRGSMENSCSSESSLNGSGSVASCESAAAHAQTNTAPVAAAQGRCCRLHNLGARHTDGSPAAPAVGGTPRLLTSPPPPHAAMIESAATDGQSSENCSLWLPGESAPAFETLQQQQFRRMQLDLLATKRDEQLAEYVCQHPRVYLHQQSKVLVHRNCGTPVQQNGGVGVHQNSGVYVHPEDELIVQICSDSAYVVNCVTSWMQQWKANNWKKKDRTPVKNRDLLEAIDALLCGRIQGSVAADALTAAPPAATARPAPANWQAGAAALAAGAAAEEERQPKKRRVSNVGDAAVAGRGTFAATESAALAYAVAAAEGAADCATAVEARVCAAAEGADFMKNTFCHMSCLRASWCSDMEQRERGNAGGGALEREGCMQEIAAAAVSGGCGTRTVNCHTSSGDISAPGGSSNIRNDAGEVAAPAAAPARLGLNGDAPDTADVAATTALKPCEEVQDAVAADSFLQHEDLPALQQAFSNEHEKHHRRACSYSGSKSSSCSSSIVGREGRTLDLKCIQDRKTEELDTVLQTPLSTEIVCEKQEQQSEQEQQGQGRQQKRSGHRVQQQQEEGRREALHGWARQQQNRQQLQRAHVQKQLECEQLQQRWKLVPQVEQQQNLRGQQQQSEGTQLLARQKVVDDVKEPKKVRGLFLSRELLQPRTDNDGRSTLRATVATSSSWGGPGKIEFVLVKGHSGVQGNEMADRLACAGAKLPSSDEEE